MKRMLVWKRIRADKIEAYKESHRQVWPELLAAYRKAGIHQLSCFLHGVDLMVFSEYDEAIYPAAKEKLDQLDVCRRWDAWMSEFLEPGFQMFEFEEVFRME